MGKHYNQLTLEQRYHIQSQVELGISARQIARRLSISNKTVSRELKRCDTGAYDAKKAEVDKRLKQQSSTKYTKCSTVFDFNIKRLLCAGFSPEQIAGRIALESPSTAVCTQTLYRRLAAKGWRFLLARKGKAYRVKSSGSAGVRCIPDRVDISERPSIVDENTEIGHWEGDTIYSHDGYIVTLTERVSKLLLMAKVPTREKGVVSQAIKRLLRPFKEMCHSITFDNGGEFADHKSIAKALKCETYFAKPYCSYQRGLNENTNGLIRRFFPKGTSIAKISRNEIKAVQRAINGRPRKALGFLSPLEFLTNQRVSLIVGI